MISPQGDLKLSQRSISASGLTSPDAVVSVNGMLASVDDEGNFTAENVPLNEGPNLLEIIASDLSGAMASEVLAVAVTEGEAVFGVVSDIEDVGQGLTRITLNSRDGTQSTVESSIVTGALVPGRTAAAVGDIRIGDSLAVTGSVNRGAVSADLIMVKPASPVSHTHIVAARVGASETGDVRLMDAQGNLVNAAVSNQAGYVVETADVVTAALRQDLKTGSLVLSGAQSWDDSVNRLRRAIEESETRGPQGNRTRLGRRLQGAVTGSLTTSMELVYRVDSNSRFIFQQAFNTRLTVLSQALDDLGLGPALIRGRGVIEGTSRTGGAVFIAPEAGPEFILNLSDDTELRVFGDPATFAKLELGQRAAFLYSPSDSSLSSLDVLFPRLSPSAAEALRVQALVGELQGTLASAPVAGSVTLRLDSRALVTLAVSDDVRVNIFGQPAGLEGLALGANVKALYDPDLASVVAIDVIDVNQTFVSGVVESIVPKFRAGLIIPGAGEEGNIIIITPQGDRAVLKITQETLVERDGVRLNIGAPRLGDLVRPTTGYDPSTRNLIKLSVRSPEVRGTVRGTLERQPGRRTLTLSTDSLKLVSFNVLEDTVLLVRGDEGEEEAAFDALEVGSRVVYAQYEPFTGGLSKLLLDPPRVRGTSGSIALLDNEKGVIAIAPPTGGTIRLLVPNKPGIITVNGQPGSLRDLTPDLTIDEVYYDGNNIVVRLTASGG